MQALGLNVDVYLIANGTFDVGNADGCGGIDNGDYSRHKGRPWIFRLKRKAAKIWGGSGREAKNGFWLLCAGSGAGEIAFF